MAAYLPDPTRNAYMGATAEKIRRPYSSEELWSMFDPWMRRRDIIKLSPREVRLLATIDALAAERDRLRDALEDALSKYGTHRPRCAVTEPSQRPEECTCGLFEALAGEGA